MKRKVQKTNDGSFTIFDEEFQTAYHSVFGARSESEYVFLEQGKVLEFLQSRGKIRILEIGTGTGLNLFLTAKLVAHYPENQVFYYGFEPRPLETKVLRKFYENTDFPEQWLEPLTNRETRFRIENVQVQIFYEAWRGGVVAGGEFDVIYYDAFGPRQHPEMWTEKMLLGIYKNLKQGGRAVTFSITGNTKRILRKYKIPFHTPKGFGKKREMLVIEKRNERF